MGFFNNLQSLIHKTTSIKSKKKAIKIPEIPENFKSVEYELISEVTTANIQGNFYSLKEPVLNQEEEKQYEIIKRGIFEIINLETPEDSEDYIEKITKLIISETDLRLSENTSQKISYLIHKNFIGLGKIEALIKDPFISEINFDTSIQVKHKLFENLSTDIMLKENELNLILRKLAILCKKDISNLESQTQYSNENLAITIYYNPNSITESKFKIIKKQTTSISPNQLINENKLSPAILSYLWMAIEAKKNIFFINDSSILNSMSYFLPPHIKILSNLKDYEPNPYTTTFIGDYCGEEDYAILENYKKEQTTANVIASTENIENNNNILCYIENGRISSIKEDGIEIFKFSNNQFLSNLNNSKFFIAKGKTIAVEDFNLRTKLLTLLSRINQKPKDFKKIIKIYYENPVAVLKKAGLL
ncbi:hypothetical protein HN681_01265 [archaeon]|jgi:hypothetical protein|nr:hypothetical protein [archaeon]MBT3730685.1 hypothetical protein [archaeon]MBT4669587.1 hypothetical protein [archaeon]MBT5030344.1 hypothetical protein [archaeon]MBT5288363.1 hypothetical protein [archaeon]